mmetsp:Transcript_19102/g.48561  ORF Transcript_19102/g.48561 Transcript_19102/m.48561 type:complete len:115 (+) Transcript_19102:436-780(+)|eukprot:CAMPEP_0177642874 /NCGR_PEP_ID=MMETSP0447-20121125/7851_1 /TAXON_ID=0 /ORGANISM="Stygamoeba regulata, Strain BSH-02190019" /LENGTH=114 /DNA_ID=CAMNT_0019145125 /DNA_START=359 /DNA_END=703 /DNA_ORIENTATION=-
MLGNSIAHDSDQFATELGVVGAEIRLKGTCLSHEEALPSTTAEQLSHAGQQHHHEGALKREHGLRGYQQMSDTDRAQVCSVHRSRTEHLLSETPVVKADRLYLLLGHYCTAVLE